jgi:hypothetical protein
MVHNLALTALIPSGTATKDQAWKVLVIKARNAAGFVLAITASEVVEESGPNRFTRKSSLFDRSTVLEDVDCFGPSLVSGRP